MIADVNLQMNVINNVQMRVFLRFLFEQFVGLQVISLV